MNPSHYIAFFDSPVNKTLSINQIINHAILNSYAPPRNQIYYLKNPLIFSLLRRWRHILRGLGIELNRHIYILKKASGQ